MASNKIDKENRGFNLVETNRKSIILQSGWNFRTT